MTSGQRTIKNIVMVLAVALAIFIILSIAKAVFLFLGIYTGVNDAKNAYPFSQSFAGEKITAIDLDNWSGRVEIRRGDAFTVQGENVSGSFVAELRGQTLVIENEEDSNWLGALLKLAQGAHIVLTVPEQANLARVEVQNGAGITILSDLKCGEILLEGGAGNLQAERVRADKARIDGGAGTMEFSECVFTDASMESGVGSFTYDGALRGDSQIRCGVGKVALTLADARDAYEIDVSTGLGGIYLDGQQAEEQARKNSGAPYFLQIDGGVGRVDVDFAA